MADAHAGVFQPRNEVELELAKMFTIAAWRLHEGIHREVLRL
jgi:hypothetical protein